MNISDDIESIVPFLYRQCRNRNIGMMQVILQTNGQRPIKVTSTIKPESWVD
jgi:hypothetical protein